MSEIDSGDDDWGTGARVPIPNDLPPRAGQVEDYQDLHHTFIGGAGNYHPHVTAVVVEEEPHEPPPVNWLRLIWLVIVAAVAALGLLIAWVVHHFLTRPHTAPAASSSGTFHSPGYALALVVVVVVGFVVIRALARYLGR